MLSNGSSLAAGRTLARRVGATSTVQTRGFAVNPNDIAKRITSTKSIEKITKSMKMVSAAKLRGDTQRLMDGRPFNAIFDRFFQTAPVNAEGEPVEAAEPKNPFYMAISSDRGLCGGVNSVVSKRTKLELDETAAAGHETGLLVIGEKGANQLRRSHSQFLVSTVDEIWRTPMNFAKASNIVQRALPALAGAEAARIVYNKFVSAIAYDTEVASVPNFPVLAGDAEDPTNEELPHPLNQFEIEPDVPVDFLQNFFEYSLACQVYGCAVENATSEQSARMTAMDNASKNASEMIESLTVLYNRARQARITTELIEIISGAESLKG